MTEHRLAARGAPIVAIATAAGRGAVGVVRASGRDLSALIQQVCGRSLAPRHATLLDFLDARGQPIDRGLALHFPAPHSYTGEDVLELQAHGGPVVLQLLLARCLQALPGARLAAPGEFTERAFLNDKLDLAQAEAVADMIDAGTEAAARSAGRALAGELSHRVDALAQRTRWTSPRRRSTSCSRPMLRGSCPTSPRHCRGCRPRPGKARCCARACAW